MSRRAEEVLSWGRIVGQSSPLTHWQTLHEEALSPTDPRPSQLPKLPRGLFYCPQLGVQHRTDGDFFPAKWSWYESWACPSS